MKIYKYKIPEPLKLNVLEMPTAAQTLFVGVQENEIIIWVLVNSETELEKRYFYVAGTGVDFPDSFQELGDSFSGKYLSSVQMPTYSRCSADLVWHVFEVFKET